MRGVAFIGGEGPPQELSRSLVNKGDLVVAADSGLTALEEAGLTPHWIVGDMDSLDDENRLSKYPMEIIIRFPHDKDFSDTEIALDLLWKKDCNEAWIIGGGGGRLDHLLAIRSLFERDPAPDRWISAREDVWHIKGEKTFIAKPNSRVSVFPLGNGPWEAESTGLEWPLSGLPWDRGYFGLSNRTITGEWTIKSRQGRFLVVLPIASI